MTPIEKQIKTVRDYIECLKGSFSIRAIGDPNYGKIEEPGINDEIAVLEDVIKTLKAARAIKS